MPIERSYIGQKIPNSNWYDWKWHIRNSLKSINDLIRGGLIVPPEEMSLLRKVIDAYRINITPYIIDLIDLNDQNDPIRRQFIPAIEELLYTQVKMPVTEITTHYDKFGLEHLYKNRVAFRVTEMCASYCRHCYRKEARELKEGNKKYNYDKEITYIRKVSNIDDVLLTGGDALLLSNFKLEELLDKLRNIEHVNIIRIGTRVLTCLPYRITKDPELINILKKHVRSEKPIFIGTQFNHSYELNNEAKEGIRIIKQAGIELYNQSVLLKGVNDNVESLRSLFSKLVQLGVRPYYLYHSIPINGTEHFRTTINEGLKLLDKLRNVASGLAIPHFIVDTYMGGKAPLSPYKINKKNEIKGPIGDTPQIYIDAIKTE